MIAYAYDKNGYYVGEITMQKNPRPLPDLSDEFLLPAKATLVTPHAVAANKENKWDGSAWITVPSRAWIQSVINLEDERWVDPQTGEIDEALKAQLIAQKDAAEAAEQEIINRKTALKAKGPGDLITLADLRDTIIELRDLLL
jgi:hypothetical protein